MASTPAIPAFEATPIDSIEGTCKSVRSVFRTHKTKNVEWRKVQLRKLYWAVVDHQPLLEAALMADLRKSAYEARLSEIEFVKNDILFMLKHVDRFARDEKVTAPEIPWVYRAAAFRKRKEPLGAVLIIGPFNYPLNLTLMPLVGAIAAGCTAVVKPSESAPATAAVMKRIVEAGLDREAFAVVNGAVPETTALLDQKWGKVFYTGSSAVGTLIARKAAETLTPVTLELGGRNPAFVTRNTNLKLAARRLLWGKTFNAGQTCLSHNYVLVEKEVLDGFVRELTSSLGDFFPGGARDSDMARIVNERHFLRIKKMVDETKGRIVLGGQMDQSALYIEPTVVVVDSMDDTMIAEESFGPVFALYPVNTLSEAINVANAVDPTPLALFSLGSKAENERGEPRPHAATAERHTDLTAMPSPQRGHLGRRHAQRLLHARLGLVGRVRRRRHVGHGLVPR